ncbi:MAG: hypothetical protein KJ561_05030 [Nanoarchaeota archaeon]|nr:hypothetical protein [Nanoarchaeota archaeon]
MLKYLKNTCFVKSLKLDKRILYAALLDMAFFISALIIIALFLFLIRSGWASLAYLTPSIERMSSFMGNLSSAPNAAAISDVHLIYTSLRSFMIKSGMLLVFFAILLVLSSSFLKSLAWSIILRERLKAKFFLKFALILFTFNLFWILLFALFAFGINPEISTKFVFVEIFSLLYLSIMFYPIFAVDKKIWQSIKKTLFISFLRSYKVIAQVLLLLSIIYILANLIAVSARLKTPFAFISLTILLFIYLAWIKVYMALLTQEILKKERLK